MEAILRYSRSPIPQQRYAYLQVRLQVISMHVVKEATGGRRCCCLCAPGADGVGIHAIAAPPHPLIITAFCTSPPLHYAHVSRCITMLLLTPGVWCMQGLGAAALHAADQQEVWQLADVALEVLDDQAEGEDAEVCVAVLKQLGVVGELLSEPTDDAEVGAGGIPSAAHHPSVIVP